MNEIKFTNYRKVLILIFLVALIVRLAPILQQNDIPSSDAAVYDRLGLSISQGKGYVDTDGMPHSFYPPFYPFFLALIYKIFGYSYLAVGIVQSIIGAISCVLIYVIGKKVYGEAVGLIAGFISVAYLPFIKSAGLLLTELVFTFLLLLMVLYLFKIRDRGSIKDCLILGLLSGIALLTKSVMIFFPIFIAPIFMDLKNSSWITSLKKYGVVILFFILSVAPWTIRNYTIYHKFVPVSTQTGIGFYSSYCPANGIFGVLASPNDTIMIEAGKLPSVVSQSDFLVKKTLEFIINNPIKVFILELKKILYFWAPFDWEIVGNRWFNFIYVAVLPFFAIGLFIGFKAIKRFYPILLPIIYFQIMALIFYGSPRFRLPVEPYIFILSFIGILDFFKLMQKWNKGH